MKALKAVFLVILLSTITLSLTGRVLAAQWVKYDRNPVLTPTPNGWDAGGVYLPRVFHSGTTFRMWYLGYGAGLEGSGEIGYAVSSDGVNWKKHLTPVLLPGPQGAWDSYSVSAGSVIWNGTHYTMFYRGLGPLFEFGGVGLATSPNGINWTKYYANPILTNKSFGVQVLDYPYVMRSDSGYQMWCTGQRAGESPYMIFYATSGNGIDWSERAQPVLTPELGGWDGFGVYDATVISDGSRFFMWYSSHPGIGYAASKDGLTWTKSIDNPILSRGPVGSWDHFSVGNQAVVMLNDSVLIYYSAAKALKPDEAKSSIGFARSPQDLLIPEFPLDTVSLLSGVALLLVSLIFVRLHSCGRLSAGKGEGRITVESRHIFPRIC